MSVGTMTTGYTVWFTGMAGAGKSVLAQTLAQRLKKLGWNPEVLDGPEVAKMLAIGGAQTKDERNAEARRLAWVCRLVTRGGGIVFQSAVQSPNREARDDARRSIGRFVEVFVDCEISQLISRDRTGQYKKALSGELKNLPGISEPYEPPTHPEVMVDTGKMSLDDCIEHLVGQLAALRYIDPVQASLKSRPKLSAVAKLPPRPPPLSPVPQPVLYKAPPKPPLAAKAVPKPAAAKPAAKSQAPVAAKPAAAAKVAAPAKAAAPAKPLPKPKLVVAKKPEGKPAAKISAKPAAKDLKPRPAAKTASEPRHAAGGRKH